MYYLLYFQVKYEIPATTVPHVMCTFRCWCGSDGISFEANGEDSEFCDLECSGDSEWICGGHSAFSLYKTEPLTITLHKPQVSQLASSAEYVGCVADDGEDRVLANMKAATDVTPEVQSLSFVLQNCSFVLRQYGWHHT